MHDHTDAVTGCLHVGFNVAVSQINGTAKSSLTVLWKGARATTMSKGDRALTTKERMQLSHLGTIHRQRGSPGVEAT